MEFSKHLSGFIFNNFSWLHANWICSFLTIYFLETKYVFVCSITFATVLLRSFLKE